MNNQTGGKKHRKKTGRKPNNKFVQAGKDWRQEVMDVWTMMKKKNPNAKYGNAMKAASKARKARKTDK
jgi:adenosine/AMP kinase